MRVIQSVAVRALSLCAASFHFAMSIVGSTFAATASFTACIIALAAAPAGAQGPPDLKWMQGGHWGVKEFLRSPRGDVYLTAGDGTIKIWSTQGVLQRTIGSAVGNPVRHSIVFTPDGENIIVGTPWVPGLPWPNLKIYSVADGHEVQAFNTGAGNIFSVNLTSDAQEIVVGAGFENIKTWRVSDGQLLNTISTGFSSLRSVAVSPDQTLVAAAGNFFTSIQNIVQIYDRKTNALVQTLTGFTFLCTDMRFSPDGTLLAACDWGSVNNPGKILIWRVADWELLHTLLAPIDAGIDHSAFSPDGTRIVGGGSEFPLPHIRLWNVQTGSLLNEFPVDGPAISALEFNDNQTVGVAAFSGVTWIFDVNSGQILQQIGMERGTIGGPRDNTQGALAFNPANTLLAAGGTPTGSNEFAKLEIFNVSDGTIIASGEGHTAAINALAWSLDGTRIASGSGYPPTPTGDPSVRYWSAPDAALLWTALGHFQGTTAVAISPDGTRVISGGRDNNLKVWNAANGALMNTLTGHTHSITCLAISPDQEHLISSAFDSTIRIWSLPDLTPAGVIHIGDWSAQSLAFSPDGETLFVTTNEYGNNPLLLHFPSGTPKVVCESNGFAPHWSAVFLPDGEHMLSVSGGYPPRLNIWNAADGSLKSYYNQETGWRYSPALAASSDGLHIAIGRYDSTIVLAQNPFAPAAPVLGDVTGDGVVDVDDLIAVILSWGACSACNDCPADFDDNCAVDVDDLIAVILNWG